MNFLITDNTDLLFYLKKYRNSRKEIPIWQVMGQMDGLHVIFNHHFMIMIHIISHNSFLTRVLVHCWKPKSYYQVKACCIAFFPASVTVLIAQVIFIYSDSLKTLEQMGTYFNETTKTFDLTCIHDDDLPWKRNIFLGNSEPWKRRQRMTLKERINNSAQLGSSTNLTSLFSI